MFIITLFKASYDVIMFNPLSIKDNFTVSLLYAGLTQAVTLPSIYSASDHFPKQINIFVCGLSSLSYQEETVWWEKALSDMMLCSGFGLAA